MLCEWKAQAPHDTIYRSQGVNGTMSVQPENCEWSFDPISRRGLYSEGLELSLGGGEKAKKRKEGKFSPLLWSPACSRLHLLCC